MHVGTWLRLVSHEYWLLDLVGNYFISKESHSYHRYTYNGIMHVTQFGKPYFSILSLVKQLVCIYLMLKFQLDTVRAFQRYTANVINTLQAIFP